MASSTPFKDLIKKPQSGNVSEALAITNRQVEMPTNGGRQTQPEGVSTIGSLLAEFATVDPDFNFKLLGALEMLAIYNPEISYAVDNIVQLGNTIGTFPENVKFDDSIGDEQSKDMIAILKADSKKWYKGGINSLVNDLLAQAAISGAVSEENIPSLSLDCIEKVVLVSPKTIRFKYSKEVGDFEPYQYSNTTMGSVNGVKLNEATYNYYAGRRVGEKPYGIPPFISALENIQISRDMSESLKFVAKKMGILGFLEVLVKGPTAEAGEKDEDYFKRTEEYLQRVRPQVEKGMSKGYVIGFENSHKFNMQPTTTNVQGAKDLIEVNDVKLMAALKQDPLMFGRNFSTTESLARVILAKMTTQVKNYQKLVVTILEEAFRVNLNLRGFAVNNVQVTVEPPMTGDAQRDATTRKIQIENLKSEYNQGIISQQTFAQELGREEPDQDEPRTQVPIFTPTDGDAPPLPERDDATGSATESNRTARQYAIQLGVNAPDYPYGSCGHAGCGTNHNEDLSFMNEEDDFHEFIREYFVDTSVVFDAAVNKVTGKIAAALAELGEGASLERIQDVIIFNLFKEWGNDFSVPQRRVVNRFIRATYDFFRKDDSIFGGATNIPRGSLRAPDLRAIEYLKKSDNLYLGRFVTDADLKRKITAYIQEQFIEGDGAINSAETIRNFRKQFPDVLKGQEWKLARIITTTVNKIRNYAAVNYMSQAGVDNFEIRGVNDERQCPYCAALQGFRFSVARAEIQMTNTVGSDPEIVGVDAPFVTSVFKTAEDMEGLSSQELQDRGIAMPPFHPHCRDQALAVL